MTDNRAEFSADFYGAPGVNFDVVRVTQDPLWQGKSVTNDAENVVELVLFRYGNYPIIYRDTEGQWDELQHDGEKFVGFRCLGAQDPMQAVRKLKELLEEES